MSVPFFRTLLLATLALCLALPCIAASRPDESLHQACLDVGTDLRLMCVAAHPDDEDGATLALYRKQYGYKTVAVIGTRGEGGQNEIGPELYNELGVIRTREMMRAAEVTGADLHFLDLPEFGYSKTIEETYEKWGREETVRRLVRVIRETRPDVIITHHGGRKDHGHHQALGDALVHAFDAAGDPATFPEAGDPWQPARLYRRVWGDEETGDDTVTVDINAVHEPSGATYAEIAARALEQHKSQGMQYFIDRLQSGNTTATYRLLKESPEGVRGAGRVDAPGGTLFAGLKDRVTKGERAVAKASPKELKKRLSDVNPLTGPRQADVDQALAAYQGIEFELVPSDDEVIPGQAFALTCCVVDIGGRDAGGDVLFEIFQAHRPTVSAKAAVGDDGVATTTIQYTVPDEMMPTVPAADHLFDPGIEYTFDPVHALVTTSLGELRLTAPVNLTVAPPITVEFLDAPYLVRRNVDNQFDAAVRVTNHSPDPVESAITLSLTPGIAVPDEKRRMPFSLASGESADLPFKVRVHGRLEENDLFINAALDDGRSAHFETARLMDLEVPESINVGVVQSYNDIFVKTLERMKVPHARIEESDWNRKRLDAFTAIIVDIRAYLVRPDLLANNDKLLKYAKRGGTVIVMYQKTREWKEAYAPYPIHVSHNRVTVEEAPVTLLKPDHPLFTTPNAIQPSDWDGWIQERGLYFPDTWDERYTPLVACNDPGEDIPPGSVLVADVGDGVYMYTSLVWYRQLRELNPGALRLFANMLALGTK
ncbi:MAG: PIG-L family deacetylase [bacterium]|nr:PIG-L family deacetylase [bacterium]